MKKSTSKLTRAPILRSIIIACIIYIVAFIILPTTAYGVTTIPDATSQFYVNDFADVFTDEEESRLMETAVALADEHDGIQVVVTTIDSLGGYTIEHYALEMYNKYGIGKNDMGLLILLSTGDREIRVEVGRAMEAYINDSKAGRFIDNYAIPSLSENRFNEGLINLQEAFINEIISCVEKESFATVVTTPEEATQKTTETAQKSNGVSAQSVACFTFVITLAVIITIVVCKKSYEKELSFAKQNSSSQEESFNNRISEMTSKYSKELVKLNGKIRFLESENERLSSSYENLLQKYNTLQDRYNRAKTLNPDIDTEVSAMIAKEIQQKDIQTAQNVDAAINVVVHMRANKNIVYQLESVLNQYSCLTETQKSYVTADISRVRTLHSHSLKLKKEYEEQIEQERRQKCAAAALAAITAIIASISVGRVKDLNNLRRAKNIYDNLDTGSRSVFDSATLRRLEKLLDEAIRDKRQEEEEENERLREKARHDEQERRRRQQSMHRSTSSFSSGRSHSGFGGRSGGGGAGRKF